MVKKNWRFDLQLLFRNSYVLANQISLNLIRKLYFVTSSLFPTQFYNVLSIRTRGIFFSLILNLLSLLFLPYAIFRMRYLRQAQNSFPLLSGDSQLISRKQIVNTERVFWFFSPIDWSFRYQRPQSIASEFAKLGEKVVFVNPTLMASDKSLHWLTETINNCEIISFHTNEIEFNTYIGARGIPLHLAQNIAILIEHICATKSDVSCKIIVQQPGWWPVVKHLQGNHMIFDCMDLHSGFDVQTPNLNEHETQLIKSAETIIVSSQYLFDNLEIQYQKKATLIRNGVAIERFKYQTTNTNTGDVVVGYFGAIAEWFDADLVYYLAVSNLNLHFQLIGAVTNKNVLDKLSDLDNVTFLGEIPIDKIPEATENWRVGLIPFLNNDLIKATNPVKMYEYAALGLPIVATDIPEVKLAANDCGGIFTSSSHTSFNDNLALALSLAPQVRAELSAWAYENSWRHRATSMILAIDAIPLISVVILMWNQGSMTLNCLKSVIQRSDYPNLEIILVDNASEEHETELIQKFIDSLRNQKIKYIRNESNVGFARGNNVGIENSSGEYIVILNNDTEVAPGWLWRLLKHFIRNPNLGLVGPSTNNCGNEARVALRNSEEEWLAEVVPRFNFRTNLLVPVRTLAFFCVLISRKAINSVGLISEDYGLGYFEDDDYCRRAELQGFKIGIARDVFVYHKMSGTFNMLSKSKRETLFHRNRLVYESKWGRWVPHKYAEDSDQV